MKISIIIPVYNEQKTIAQVLQTVDGLKLDKFTKEIIVVDDGSKDASKEQILKTKISGMKFYSHDKNMGKGAAIKTGIDHATGEYIVIQDADTEYNPEDIKKLLVMVGNDKDCVVYGTRLNRMPNFSQDERTLLFFSHYFGNRFLSLFTSLLYGQWLTDMETCYKLFPRAAVLKMKLNSRGFAFEPEITAKLLKLGYKIKEVSITTKPRDYSEGKKLHAWKEGPIALWTLLKYRFTN